MTTTIGILGAGQVGKALAGHLAKAGYMIVLANRRGPESLKPLIGELGSNARAGTPQDVVKAPIIFLCVKWEDIPAAVAPLGSFAGKIVVDTSNPYLFGPNGELSVADLGERSSSDIVAGHIPGAHLVKAFNNLVADVMARDPREAGGRRIVFVSGDDAAAKTEIKTIADKIGFAPVDLGGLAIGGRVQQGRGPFSGQNFIRLS